MAGATFLCVRAQSHIGTKKVYFCVKVAEKKGNRLDKRQPSFVSVGWSQVGRKKGSDHIICKAEVITRFAALNSRAHSGEHAGSRGSLHAYRPSRLLVDKLLCVYEA